LISIEIDTGSSYVLSRRNGLVVRDNRSALVADRFNEVVDAHQELI
jgi:hypothetical protein